jgi:hypothetical protein
MREKFEDTKGAIRIRITVYIKEEQTTLSTMAKRKSTKGQTTIYFSVIFQKSTGNNSRVKIKLVVSMKYYFIQKE